MIPEPLTPDILFVGRTREVETLTVQWQAALAGRLRVVLVAGEPGIGKSRLLRRAAEIAFPAGIILRGGAYEAEGMPPYLPFVEVLTSYVRDTSTEDLRQEIGAHAAILSRILPDLADRLAPLPSTGVVPEEQARFRLFEAVAELLVAVSRRRPVLLLLDDLQWGDPSTLELLAYLVHRAAAGRILVIGAYRDESRQSAALDRLVAELSRSRVLTHLTLAPLLPPDIQAVAETQLHGRVDQRLVRFLHDQSAGNPFFAEELVRGWHESGGLVQRHGCWALRAAIENVPPTSIISVVRRRLAAFSADTIDLLRVAAVVGRTFTVGLLADVLETTAGEVEDRLEQAVQGRLIREDGPGRYRFAHDTVRECVYAEVSSTRRRRLHERIGRVLEQREMAQPDELAFHFARSGDGERGISYSLAAAGAARRGYAPSEALTHLATALDLLPSADPRRAPLLLEMGEVAILAGQEEQAQAAFEAAQQHIEGDRALRQRALHGLALALWRQGRMEQARSTFAAALLCAGDELSPPTVRLQADLAALLNAGLGLQDEALEHAGRALEAAQRLGDRRLEAAATKVAGQARMRGGDFRGGLAALEQALGLARAAGDPAEAADICGILANGYYAQFDLDRSRQVTMMRLDLARRTHQPHELRHVHTWLALLALFQGDWEEAETMLAEARPIVEELADDEPRAVLYRTQGLLDLHRERYAAAEQAFRAAIALIEEQGPHHLAWYLGPYGLSLCAQGKRAEVLACMDRIEGVITHLPAGSVPRSPALACLVEMALWAGDRQRAQAHEAALSTYRGLFILVPMQHALAHLEMERGDTAPALNSLARLEHDLRRGRLLPFLPAALRDRARLLLDTGAADQATALLTEALALCQQLGLHETGAGIEQLRHQGWPAARPCFPAGLSAREVEVLSLIAQGKSNREIADVLHLSPSTVANHATSIFNKTAVENRAAAAAYAIHHGLA